MHERKSETEITHSCPTLRDPIDCSLPGSSVHGIFQARVLEWVANAFSVLATRPSVKSQVNSLKRNCLLTLQPSQIKDTYSWFFIHHPSDFGGCVLISKWNCIPTPTFPGTRGNRSENGNGSKNKNWIVGQKQLNPYNYEKQRQMEGTWNNCT